jgi:hypothetical protein
MWAKRFPLMNSIIVTLSVFSIRQIGRGVTEIHNNTARSIKWAACVTVAAVVLGFGANNVRASETDINGDGFVNFKDYAIANTRKPRIRAKPIITEFLSSVELGKDVYDFDHNADGVIDMFVYPLKTENPDLKTKYITLEEALNKKQLVLKENQTIRPTGDNPQGIYTIVAQFPGYRNYRQSYGSGYRGYGPGSGYGPSYYPRGGLLGGGWQSRGFGSGGILGGYGDGGWRGYPGYGSYGRFGFEEEDLRDSDFKKTVDMGDFGLENTELKYIGLNFSKSNPGAVIDALCFEKWRLIEESRLRGEPKHFSYTGMASPFIRKELILFSNQINIHMAIEKELRKLGVYSRTAALVDVFRNQAMKKIINYYITNSRKVLKDKDIAGIIVTNRNKILCADVYSSPGLFKKMYPQLMQSAALGILQKDRRSRKHLEEADVEEFLDTLKKVEKLKKETSQTYRLFYRKIISGAELYTDKDGTRVVHLEAYPR